MQPGLFDREKIQAVLLVARDSGESPLTALLRDLSLPEAIAIDGIADYTGFSYLPFNEAKVLRALLTEIAYDECLRRNCVVLQDASGRKRFVTDNPFDSELTTWVSYKLDGVFDLSFMMPVDLKKLLGYLQSAHGAFEQVVRVDAIVERTADLPDISLDAISKDTSPVVRIVNSTLYDAHQCGASDIHFENTSTGLVTKYRIDGVLAMVRQLADQEMAEQVISRIKILSELDIGEKRVPQDGRFSAAIQAREIDFRVSVMPGLFGEDAVIRILDKQALSNELQGLRLNALGIEIKAQKLIRKLANQPHGMLLVTGPTGSGKTTTLYATIGEINHGEEKIITIEDPVEYQLNGVLQIPVNEKKGLNFAKGLRSILRHDPDRILVGEIRDRETAEIAIQAALTGHLVYTTVHANNVFDVLSRFRHMGVDLYSFVTALNGVLAQRLIRLNCIYCAVLTSPDPDDMEGVTYTDEQMVHGAFSAGVGCAHCRGTGYKGRMALTELLEFDDELRELILKDNSISTMKKLAKEKGMISMRQAGLALALTGKTTLKEVNRVTFSD